MQLFTKDVEATLKVSFDWSDDLAEGETIETLEWTIPEELTVIDEPDPTGAVTTIKLGGGVLNSNYKGYSKITTSDENVFRRAFGVQVRDAATFDEPGDAEAALAAVRAVIRGTANKQQKEYTIGNRHVVRYDMTELLALESRLIQQVNQERITKALRQGVPFLKNVHTRFR